MTNRFTNEHIEAWRKEGAVVVPEFFKDKEIKEVAEDFEIIFPGRSSAPELNRICSIRIKN